ncbi:DUF2797 domain-containing protein [Halorubrum trapanicum]|uniref:DUF2797 domain-containing protein n=1 Tax=Halorubrum trapanicum TaxID=29284 RepID=UPI000BBB0159|nr:DUF2797 domain-containing protein [Halorubrum trapanicum]
MQVVGYETDVASGSPEADGDSERAPNAEADGPIGGGLYVASGGTVDFVDAGPGAELAFGLGERRCAGTVHEGDHVACDAPDAPYCDDHSHVWVCARCTGTCLKDEMDCHETHAMYLAAFAPDVLKVGVTREWRLGTRLREQGADRAAHIRTFPNGRIAREVEAELAAGEDLVDRVRVPTKLDGFGRSVDEAAWEALLDRFEPIERFAFDYGLDLDERPVAETMAAGTVRGWKGRVIVLDRGGSTYAVDARDLVGYELTDAVPERELQSSLGAFGG